MGPRMETCANWGEPIAMVLCLHQGNIYIKRKLRLWRDHKCILLVGAKTPFTCAGRQTTLYQGNQYRAENQNLHKFGWTYHHGTVFVPRQCLYQNKATDTDTPEMYFPSWFKTPQTCAGRQTTLSQMSRYRPENGNLRKLGWTYRHGTVFAPRQYLSQKEATGKERPEMYSPTRCKNPSYLCRPSNYSV